MEFRQLGFLSALLFLSLVGCHVQASVSATDYWVSLWPNTPMPKALRDLTHSGGRSYGKVGENKIDVDVYGAANRDNDPTSLKLDDAVINVTFFFEHDLRPGNNFYLEDDFTERSDDYSTFLPDAVAKTIPFSTSRFPEILSRFNIEPESSDAAAVKYTLQICEKPAVTGEDKFCATSLESLLGFTVSKLGKNIRVLSTVMEKEKEKEKEKEFRVVEGVEKVGDKAVACHKLNYPYAVFYCHKVATRAYSVPLVANDGDDGTKVKALAVCHTDTIKWSHKNLAFQQLNVKPGTVPVCHFLSTHTLLWLPN